MSDPWAGTFDAGEEIIWQGQPDKNFVPERVKWVYTLGAVLTGGLWLSSPWTMEAPWDFWNLFFVTLGLIAILLIDQKVRRARVYFVTNKHVWIMHRFLKTKRMPVDPYLKFSATKYGVRFDSHPFFAFDHITDTDAAISALKQAQEASR
mmetsp:Transcript_32398/g.62425  ORF Transcript_32398/g.62425 Transcript_32398/m.62425 type:complete len:150 (+) Transcript_32398:140-589(+)